MQQILILKKYRRFINVKCISQEHSVEAGATLWISSLRAEVVHGGLKSEARRAEQSGFESTSKNPRTIQGRERRTKKKRKKQQKKKKMRGGWPPRFFSLAFSSLAISSFGPASVSGSVLNPRYLLDLVLPVPWDCRRNAGATRSTAGGKARQISEGTIQPRLGLRSHRQNKTGAMMKRAGGKRKHSKSGIAHRPSARSSSSGCRFSRVAAAPQAEHWTSPTGIIDAQ